MENGSLWTASTAIVLESITYDTGYDIGHTNVS